MLRFVVLSILFGILLCLPAVLRDRQRLPWLSLPILAGVAWLLLVWLEIGARTHLAALEAPLAVGIGVAVVYLMPAQGVRGVLQARLGAFWPLLLTLLGVIGLRLAGLWLL